ncbi:MAG: carbohydrate binding family 9 domain-containing protein [Gemmatimonadales bacterium]|nr:carbohydrate binding family 9 domain-containing protein [Gemmatimonadales bacterium]
MSLLPLVLLQIQAAASPIPGRGSPVVTIPRIEAEIEIDGRLTEPAWAQAVRLGEFSQYQPVDGRPAEERTDVLVWYSPTAIHFGIVAHDRQPGSIHATVSDRDNIGNDDNVTIYLDTFNDRRRAFFFGVNPLGVQDDGVRSEGSGTSAASIFGGNIDRSPDFIYQSKGMLTDSGYVVEVRIPFKSLRFPGSGPQRWAVNFVRDTRRTGYQDTWTDVRRANASFLTQAGTLGGLHDLRRGVVTEVQPFVTAAAAGAVDATTGGFDRGAIDPSAGANLKLGFTNMALDATVNPDFSQVESDAGLVTVNERFALFLPERRPFFLEGIELFSTPNQLVYTRQIVDPVAGAKFTGKFGGLNVAYLGAVDDPGPGHAVFNIARLRHDLRGTSAAGLTYTDRIEGDAYNRVVAGDTRIIFGKLYFVQGQLGGSWTRDAAGTRHAPIWEAEFDRTGRAWGFNYQVNALGRGFETRAGFVPRSDVVAAHAFNRFSLYGARGALLESFTVFAGPNRVWRYGDFLSRGPIEGDEMVNLMSRLRGGWAVDGSLRHGFVTFDSTVYARYTVGDSTTVYQPAARLDNAFSGSLRVATPTFRMFNADLRLQRGEVAIFPEAAEGRETRVTSSLEVRPSASVRAGLSGTYSRITRRRDGSEFARTLIPRLRAEYQPSRSLFFRVVGEYQSQRRADLRDPLTGTPLSIGGVAQPRTESGRFRMDWLVSLEPTPGTVAFFGYGATYVGPDASEFSSLTRNADGFFLKLAYLFRR